MEDGVLLSREEAWQVLKVLERAVDAAEKADRDDADASSAFRMTVASKLLPDLFPDD